MDIKETKEALVGANELTLVILELVKDGVQFSDAVSLVNKLSSDPVLKQKLDEALSGLKVVPEEIKDIDLNEGIELAMLQAQYVPKILEKLK